MRSVGGFRVAVVSVLFGLCLALAMVFANCSARAPESVAPPSVAGLPDWVHLDANYCAACHATIVGEWRQAMHAKSMREDDPLYDALVKKAVQVVGPKAEVGCVKCHTPEWANAADEAGVTVEGVSCVVCHRIDPAHPKKKLASGAPAEFARTVDGATGSQGLCLSCHAAMASPQGWPVCTTGDETAGSKQSCVDCHMLAADGPPAVGSVRKTHRSHTFPGGYWPDFVRGSASLALSVDEEDPTQVMVEVRRLHGGHDLPTGNPMRSVVVRVWALDDAGETIWSNVADDPLAEDRAAVFQRLFAGADGSRPVPPFAAAGPADDNRLRPDETRQLRYPIPENAVRIEAWLEYRLGPEPLLRAAGLPEETIDPVIITKADVDLTEE